MNWECQDIFSEKTAKLSGLPTKSAESQGTGAGPAFPFRKESLLERRA